MEQVTSIIASIAFLTAWSFLWPVCVERCQSSRLTAFFKRVSRVRPCARL
jgi:hypothetical protein